MATETPAVPPLTAPGDRVALRTLAERRRRVIRSILAVVMITLALLVLSSLNRDQQAVDSCQERMEYAVREFQRHYDQDRRAPTELPLPPHSGARDHYLYNWRYADSFRPEVGVCCCRSPHTRLFQPPRRHVIILNVERGEYRVEWMKESEFADRADDLGLLVRVQP